jgi:hypothetical protein
LAELLKPDGDGTEAYSATSDVFFFNYYNREYYKKMAKKIIA